jgi:hypothetical protein
MILHSVTEKENLSPGRIIRPVSVLFKSAAVGLRESRMVIAVDGVQSNLMFRFQMKRG